MARVNNVNCFVVGDKERNKCVAVRLLNYKAGLPLAQIVIFNYLIRLVARGEGEIFAARVIIVNICDYGPAYNLTVALREARVRNENKVFASALL